jgi:hypothetical protein
MNKNTLTGILMPIILIMLHACAGSRTNSSRNASVTSTPEARVEEANHPVFRNDINIRAVRHFSKFFPSAKEEKWYVIKNGYMAKYMDGDIRTRVDYDEKGNWLYLIRYYTEKKLPRDVRGLVKSTWYDYAISSIEELHCKEQVVYLIHIHEGDDWKIIRVQDGDMSEIIPPGKANK